MNNIEINVQRALKSLSNLQRETKTTFSVYGPVVPLLLLGTLKTAINRKVGCPEHTSELLNISNGILNNNNVPILNRNDTETIINCVCKEVGDTSLAMRSLFDTSINAFNDIGSSAKELPRLEGFSDLDFKNHSKEIFEIAITQATRPRYGGAVITNPSIALLAKDILDVKQGEIFSDFVCGLGLSSSLIVSNISEVTMCLSDLETDFYAFACVGCFLRGCINYGKNEDSLSEEHFDEGLKADKIFVDPPIRARMSSPFGINGIKIKESSCSAIMKAAMQLKENGKAVVAINTGFTYGTQFEMAEIRKYLVKNKLVSDVINLPAMWPGAGVATTLLVLSKTENKEIFMIDLTKKSNDSNIFEYSRLLQTNILTKEGRETILSLMRAKTDKPGTCHVASYEDVISKDYSLLPKTYIEDIEDIKETKLSIDEIDNKIKIILSEIQSMVEKL